MNPVEKLRSDVSRILRLGKNCIVVFKWAIISRIVMLILQVIAHAFIPDHQGSMEDVSMRVHRHPPHDMLTETMLGGFDNWDSEYYIYIAHHGYTFLQSMAFFPLYPWLMWLVGRVLLFPLNFILADRSLFLLAGTLINCSVFPLAATSLYLLTLLQTDNQRLSIVTVLLFCVNPASVFMSAVYTESLFAFCTFTGLCLLISEHCWNASLMFALASATRSNGTVLAGFIAFHHLQYLYRTIVTRKSNWPEILFLTFKKAVVCILQCIVVVLPFALFQLYGYWKYCSVLPGSGEELYEWCEWTLPLPYTYIQQHYWNVGFLRYFELKQIPNFLLALPVISLSLYAVWSYIFDSRKIRQTFKESGGLLAYMLHMLFLVLFGTFNMHIQVLTRFLFSSSPVLYWFSAMLVSTSLSLPQSTPPSSHSLPLLLRTLYNTLSVSRPTQPAGSRLLAKFIISYYLVYVIIGFVLHCNFYPWT